MYLVYANTKGEPDYMEELIGECQTEQEAKRTQARAIDNGLERTRITTFFDGRPDFVGTINRSMSRR